MKNYPKRERIKYIDIAKGLLILEVVFAHISCLFYGNYPDVLSILPLYKNLLYYAIAPYVMASFFIIHGFLYRRESDFTEECKRNAYSLILPMALIMFSNFWFCWAMFFASIIYYLVTTIDKYYIQLILVAIIATIGFFLWSFDLNYLYISNAAILLPFIFLGNRHRSIITSDFVGGISFILYICLVIFLFIKNILPPIASDIFYFLKPSLIPIFYILALTGSASIFTISRKISSNRFLEYIGRHSLLFCLVHISFLYHICRHFSSSFYNFIADKTFIIQLLVFVIIYVSVIYITYIVVKVINRFFPWLEMKFTKIV